MIEPIPDASAAAALATRERLDGRAKPPGSLGRLEAIAVWLAAAQDRCPPTAAQPRVVVFAGDHGVARAQGVSPYPPEVTALMVRTFAAGKAAVTVLAQEAGASFEVVDVGVAGAPVDAGALSWRVREGTADLAVGPAMEEADLEGALDAGAAAADRAARDGVDVLAIGEMGIGNTTAASAVVARLLGLPAADVVGPGTGLDAEGVARKARVVQRALDRGGSDPRDPLRCLADLGGLEIAALTGCMLRAAHRRIPVVLDGFIVGAAALAAVRVAPGLRPFLLPATRSAEPGHAAVLEALQLGPPLLEWDLRLGEASAATLVLPLLRSATAIVTGMASLRDVLEGKLA